MKFNLRLWKVTAVAAVLFGALTFTSCQEEEMQVIPSNSDVVSSGAVDQPLVLNGDTLLFTGKHTQKKGLYLELADPDDLGEALVRGVSTYKTLKVRRRANPNQFFYIMIENLKANVPYSWAYQNNPSNEALYGRLYTWKAAYDYRNNVVMKLPKFDASGNPIASRTYPAFGRLPSFTDIKDLLTVDVIPVLPNGVNYIESNDVYNHFIFGTDETYENEAAYHSLAGWRDNLLLAPNNKEFNAINTWGRFWTNETSTTLGPITTHYPLEVKDDIDSWCAYINAGHSNDFAFAVRYVFYPTFQ